MDLTWVLNQDDRFRYRLLDRLRTDCEYYLGNGNRNRHHLWADNEKDQLTAMKMLWASFPEGKKPEWLPFEKIQEYEQQMIPEKEKDTHPKETGLLLDTSVRDWYHEMYPDDSLAADIREGLTFRKVIEALNQHADFYQVAGEGIDTFIRERIFVKAAEIVGVDYEDIYDKWLDGDQVSDIPIKCASEKSSLQDRIQSASTRASHPYGEPAAKAQTSDIMR